jgi:hypothetical protein
MATGQSTFSETLLFFKTSRLNDPFIAAGDRAYLIGAQDGGFPDRGFHTPGEMGGIWAHPIKLLDGVWLAVDGIWLADALSFQAGAFWNEQRFEGSDGLDVRRRQFAPDGLPAVVLRFILRSPAERSATIRLLARTDLQSVWPGESRGFDHAPDSAEFDFDLGAWLGRDGAQDWFVFVGATIPPVGHASGPPVMGPVSTAGDGATLALDYQVQLPASTEVGFDVIIAGCEGSPEEARRCFMQVRGGIDQLWKDKQHRYDEMLGRSRLLLPEPAVAEAWEWAKCDLDWLVRDVPGVGRGLGAGADDYVWWFSCDNGFALLACLAFGQFTTAIDTLDLLRELSVKANGESGRVIHEANTRGIAVNRGRTQETPHFIQTVWQTFAWTGDIAFLERNYDFCRHGLVGWTLGEQCRKDDVLPYGYGITEQEGLNLQCIDTAVHTAEALQALAEMAEIFDDQTTATRSRAVREEVVRRIEDFWIEEEGLYGDMLATPAEMVPRLRKWLTQFDVPVEAEGTVRRDSDAAGDFRRLLQEAESAAEPDLKRPWLLTNWIVLAPLMARLVDDERAAGMFQRIESPKFIGPAGMYLGGTNRAQAMSISTGALVEAEMRYGRMSQGMTYMRLLADTVHLRTPGAISEMSPDYGCFVQAWSAYAVAWPLVACLFGVKPRAHLRRLELCPCIPVDWDELRLEALRIGDTLFDFHWNGTELKVRASQPGWTITCDTVPLTVETQSS